jgi:Adenylate and Guanylate cyclase catalytic domain
LSSCKIGSELGTFKVETIGDSYVAVCGLPTPTPNHAVVMARFACLCLETMKDLVSRLEVSLGPWTGTASSLRSSVPVTVGVLRGAKARFDSLNGMLLCPWIFSAKWLPSEDQALRGYPRVQNPERNSSYVGCKRLVIDEITNITPPKFDAKVQQKMEAFELPAAVKDQLHACLQHCTYIQGGRSLPQFRTRQPHHVSYQFDEKNHVSRRNLNVSSTASVMKRSTIALSRSNT